MSIILTESNSRRGFLQQALTAAALISPITAKALTATTTGPQVYRPDTALPTSAMPSVSEKGIQLDTLANNFWMRPRELWLYNAATREQIRACYWRDGQVVADGYWRICAFLRDHRQNVMTAMDPGLLDILRGISGYYEQWNWPYPVVANSGFRSQITNSRIEGAAKDSLHLQGRAADIYIPGIPIADVTRLALYFQRGGVGFYPSKGFVHVDTGAIRTWRGSSK